MYWERIRKTRENKKKKIKKQRDSLRRKEIMIIVANPTMYSRFKSLVCKAAAKV